MRTPAISAASLAAAGALAAALLESVRRLDGNLIITRCDDAWKNDLPLFGTAGPARDLMRKMRSAFDPHRVLIDGPTHFSGAEIVCPPALRPAVVILLAMLASKGTSVLRSTYVIHRGYEDLAERLNQLGANIETFRDI